MSVNLGTFDYYDGITDSNYAEEGKFHTVHRPDTSLLIGVTKDDPEADTTIDLQVCLGDVNEEANWFTLLSNLSTVTNDDGNGDLVSAPTGSFTGVRIVPADSATEFTLSVREFFSPEKIRSQVNGQYLIG